MTSSPLLVAYHGCDQEVASRLVAGEAELLPSRNLYDWLGNGHYGWQDSQARGWQWACEAAKTGKIKQAAVVGMVIDPGHCLNLVEKESLDLVREAYGIYRQYCADSGMKEERNRGTGFRARYLDCLVFETLHAYRASLGLFAFDTVRGFFIEGAELYPGAGLRDRDHIQICVRNPKCIKGYFLPRD